MRTHIRTDARAIALTPLIPLAALLAALSAQTASAAAVTLPSIEPQAPVSYVVLVSDETWDYPEWRAVVDTLRTRHNADVIVFNDNVASAKTVLSEIMPRYTCLVARPEEAGRDTVVTLHRMLRELDDDPYTDTLWAVLTGYDAHDAMRIASRTEPLIVKRALGGTGAVNLDAFDEGIKFDEGQAGGRWVKHPGESTVKEDWPPDSTEGLVDAFNTFKPDLFMTSGHATERDWQIGYSYKDGSFRHKDGQLFGRDTEGKRHDIHSPNSKVFLGVGNCLIGHIDGRDCMATAMMHSAGVDQMYGYTAVTFFGYMGWGALDYFERQRDRFTLAESLFATNQALIYELLTKFPGRANIQFEHFDHHKLDALFAKHNMDNDQLIGLTWDRDIVAFYGDPAWPVRRRPAEQAWDQTLEEKGDTFTLTITPRTDGQWGGKPVFQFLPERIQQASVSHGEGYAPVITDNFIMVPLHGEYKKGDEIRIVFTAKREKTRTTSAQTPPIVVGEQPAKSESPKPEDANESAAVGEGPTPDDIKLPAGVPAEYQDGVKRALAAAGEHADELAKAIGLALEGHRPAVCFLIANMPAPDLKTISAEFLVENVKLACDARAKAAWGDAIPEDIFLNYVLPYANVNERRDAWRTDFFNRFSPFVKECKTAAEAALTLNSRVFDEINVHYHATKRPKPDQSPLESIEASYASCTGLSILLIDACRAVGVPARFVGIPQWPDQTGNHSWVEIWDGRWHTVGAAEPDARGLDHAWFLDKAAKANLENTMQSIYAASYRRTPLAYPLVWAPRNHSVSATNVTRQYSSPVQAQLTFMDPLTGKPVAGKLAVRWHDETYAAARVDDAAKPVTLKLPAREQLELVFTRADGKTVRRPIVLDIAPEASLTIDVSDRVLSARHYDCAFADQPPTIDGKLDDPCWTSAPWSEPFVDIRGEDAPTPKYTTRMKMLWGETHLYIAAQLEEPHVWATLRTPDAIVFHDNDFEIFIDPNGDSREYYEIEINALNTIFDLFLVRTYRAGGPALHDWTMRGLESAVFVDGTLNDPRDTDTAWTVEFALPWRSLAEAAGTPTPPADGDTWRINFSRVEWQHEVRNDRYIKLPNTSEDNWVWSPQGEIDMHKPDTWGYVTFHK